MTASEARAQPLLRGAQDVDLEQDHREQDAHRDDPAALLQHGVLRHERQAAEEQEAGQDEGAGLRVPAGRGGRPAPALLQGRG
ncbi:MAG: hypothetical protein KF878_05495 [Planctomycetes bacterium]|nr:hypothetical protein [Planctomycetota bacterium]